MKMKQNSSKCPKPASSPAAAFFTAFVQQSPPSAAERWKNDPPVYACNINLLILSSGHPERDRIPVMTRAAAPVINSRYP